MADWLLSLKTITPQEVLNLRSHSQEQALLTHKYLLK